MKTRTTKELLIILRDNLEDYLKEGVPGLCLVIDELFYDGIISGQENEILDNYFESNKPAYALFREKQHKDDFWWKPGKIKHRRRWLNQHIDKL